jgi:hypothetical protein
MLCYATFCRSTVFVFVWIRILPHTFEGAELTELGLKVEENKIFKQFFCTIFKRNRKNGGVIRPGKNLFSSQKNRSGSGEVDQRALSRIKHIL